MKSLSPFLFVIPAAWLLAAQPCRAQLSVPYALSSPPSQFEWGCFGPCECPVLIRSTLTGSFILKGSRLDPFFQYYEVLDVRWEVPGADGPVMVTGSGTYRRGGEVAIEEQLTLSLSFDGGPPQLFDSGLRPPGAPFPEIATRISLHQEYCHDSVLVVDAKPADPAGVGGAPVSSGLVATPNPFVQATTIGFAMPRDGQAALAVLDVGGRRARTLLERERLPAGPAVRTWDGRLDDGRQAPPGLYVVRLDTPGGRLTRLLVKLR